MATESIFIQLSVIILIAVGISFIVRIFKQPLILGYIITGILVSKYFLNLVGSIQNVETFAKMGVAVLLFMVGLNLDPKVIKEVGKTAILTGLGQIIFTFSLGFLIVRLLGFSSVTAAYISIALTFSSTIIIMKLLTDKGDISTLYGKIATGFLIVQDFVAILILMFVSAFNKSAVSFSSAALQKVSIGVGLISGLFLLSLLLLRPTTKLIARSQELLLLFSIAWTFALGSLFDYFGFSIEIGALLAGITLSISPYKYEIGAKMKPLRDFFLLIFFILLGTQLTFTNFNTALVPIIVLSVFVLIGNPIIVMIILGYLGYTKRTGLLAGLTVSQISEFSFILITLGISVGHLSPGVLSLVTVVGLLTMTVSSYTILNNNRLYSALSERLRIFERRGVKVDESKFHRDKDYEIILFGYNRIGYSLRKAFKSSKKSFLVVDNNPDTIAKLVNLGIDCRYGDAEDPELLPELPLKEAKIIFSTIPNTETNLLLIDEIKKINKKAILIVVSHQIDEALRLYEAGATYVLTPHFVGGEHAADLISDFGFSRDKYEKEGVMHAKDLVERKKEGHRDVLHERG